MAKCPHCNKQITLKATLKDKKDEVHREVKGLLKKEILYSCPHCECVLGFAFFIGGLATGRP